MTSGFCTCLTISRADPRARIRPSGLCAPRQCVCCVYPRVSTRRPGTGIKKREHTQLPGTPKMASPAAQQQPAAAPGERGRHKGKMRVYFTFLQLSVVLRILVFLWDVYCAVFLRNWVSGTLFIKHQGRVQNEMEFCCRRCDGLALSGSNDLPK